MYCSVDTNLLLYAAHGQMLEHEAAATYMRSIESDGNVVICELVLVELYILLRNPAVFKQPLSAEKAVDYVQALRSNPNWGIIDYDRQVANKLWERARQPNVAYRKIIDSRLALTLRHHGVTHFATANVRDFRNFGFDKVWNPIKR